MLDTVDVAALQQLPPIVRPVAAESQGTMLLRMTGHFTDTGWTLPRQSGRRPSPREACVPTLSASLRNLRNLRNLRRRRLLPASTRIPYYWFHTGEAQAVRQLLGHTGLPQFVGDIGREAPYRPETPYGASLPGIGRRAK